MKKPIRTGNASVEIERAVFAEGLRPVKDLKRSERHRVFVATNTSGEQFVAKATAAQMEMENLRNEVLAQVFLTKAAPENARFAFPDAKILVDDGDLFVAATTPYVTSGWLADQKHQEKLARKRFSEDDLEDLFQVMLFLHTLPKRSIPKYFLKRAKREFTEKRTIQKMRGYLEPAITADLVGARDAKRLEKLMRFAGWHQRFVHQDLLPANLARLANGKLLVCDAEFSRWGMKWWDVAYPFLQITVLYGNTQEGMRLFRYLVKRFKEELPDEDIEREIFAPLAYVLAMEFFIGVNNPQVAKRARKMYDRLIKGSIAGLLEH